METSGFSKMLVSPTYQTTMGPIPGDHNLDRSICLPSSLYPIVYTKDRAKWQVIKVPCLRKYDSFIYVNRPRIWLKSVLSSYFELRYFGVLMAVMTVSRRRVTLLHWRWRRLAFPKCWFPPPTKPQCVPSLETIILICLPSSLYPSLYQGPGRV